MLFAHLKRHPQRIVCAYAVPTEQKMSSTLAATAQKLRKMAS